MFLVASLESIGKYIPIQRQHPWGQITDFVCQKCFVTFLHMIFLRFCTSAAAFFFVLWLSSVYQQYVVKFFWNMVIGLWIYYIMSTDLNFLHGIFERKIYQQTQRNGVSFMKGCSSKYREHFPLISYCNKFPIFQKIQNELVPK